MSGTGIQAPIIKIVKKRGHGAAHGGSWKVAYADFVTAMMAFFLVMWLISMVSEDKRARVSEYFNHFSLFEKGGQSFMMKNEKTKSVIKIFDSHDTASNSSGNDNANGSNISNGTGSLTANRIEGKLKNAIKEKLGNMKDQVLVDISDGSVRIEVVDKKGGTVMFNNGSRELTADGKKALRVIAESLKGIPGKIAIEGHTDASIYAGGQYSNWELSTDRASAARRELEDSGMSPDRLIRVAGYAATEPLIKKDPLDPRNRRISIRLFPEANKSSPTDKYELSHDGTLEKGQKRAGDIKKENNGDVDPIEKYLLNK
jgi:chemotaxis protein MotB